MLTLLYLTISIFFITLTMTTLASFAKASEIFESMDDYKIPVEKNEPTDEISHAQFYWDNCVTESEKELFFESVTHTNEPTDPDTEDYPW